MLAILCRGRGSRLLVSSDWAIAMDVTVVTASHAGIRHDCENRPCRHVQTLAGLGGGCLRLTRERVLALNVAKDLDIALSKGDVEDGLGMAGREEQHVRVVAKHEHSINSVLTHIGQLPIGIIGRSDHRNIVQLCHLSPNEPDQAVPVGRPCP